MADMTKALAQYDQRANFDNFVAEFDMLAQAYLLEPAVKARVLPRFFDSLVRGEYMKLAPEI
ncbi:MAG: hypothetical protein V2I33_18410, partial [Kangiellaceae bacterium]|nr:hypothetical protein [Kangiellaceae bacterium]